MVENEGEEDSDEAPITTKKKNTNEMVPSNKQKSSNNSNNINNINNTSSENKHKSSKKNSS